MKTKFICIIVMFGLLVSLAACANPEEEKSSISSVSDVSSIDDNNDGPLVPYEQMLTITVPGVIGASHSFIEGEDFDENFVTNHYREKMNIDFRAKWLVDSSQATEKLSLAVASNDLPDMFEVSDTVMLSRLYRAGQIADLTDYYDDYVSDNLRPILEYQDSRGFLTTTFDQKFYGLPVANDLANNLPMGYIRKDWLDALDLELPETLEDLINVARAFRDADMAGNGETIAIGMNDHFGPMPGEHTLRYIANSMNAYYGIWIPDNAGGLKYSSIQPEMKDALKVMQDLYKEGLIDKGFAVKDGGKVAEDVAAGRIGIYPGVFWNPLWPLAGSVENNPQADWITIPALKNKDGQKISQNRIFSYTWVVVRKGFSNPEAVFKSMNFWYECFHGEYSDMFNDMLSTEKYKPVADLWHMQARPVFFAHPEKNLQLSANYIEAQQANDPSLLKTGEARNRWDIWKSGGSQGWAHNNFLTVSQPVVNNYDGFQFDEFLGIPTDTMQQKMANLNSSMQTAFLNIIMGDSIDDFDLFADDWLNQGGDTITSEVSAWYREVN